ncbi:MAG: hypothetical protein K0U78_13455 [Actinomycetia bacterium]|nr:hypothetical protein [Actinomycetes bacterium]
MKNERDVKARIKRVFKKYGIWYTMPHQAGYSQPGVPDFLACVRGHFLGVEAKFGKNKPTAMQHRQIAEIKQAGGTAIVVHDRNLDQFESLVYDLVMRWGEQG